MTLEEVKKELLRKAKEDAQKLIKEAEEERKRIFEKVEEKIKAKKELVDIDIKNIKEVMEKKETSSAELNAKKAILEEKKKIIDEVFEKSLDELTSLSKDERKKIFEALLRKVESEITVEKIYCNPKDKAFVSADKFVESDIIGGIIAENKDETIRVDYSYDLLLNNIKSEKLAEISNILSDDKEIKEKNQSKNLPLYLC